MEPSDGLVGVIEALIGAWNARDAPGFGALFTEDASYTGADGFTRRGRAAIAQTLSQSDPHVQVAIEGSLSVHLDESGASAQFGWIALAGEPRRHGTIDCRIVRQGGAWRIAALRNTGAH